MIRADLDLLPDPCRRPGRDRAGAAITGRAGAAERIAKAPGTATPFRRSAAPVPAWARASGRAGQGDPLFAAGAGLALLDAFLRRDPPCAGALAPASPS